MTTTTTTTLAKNPASWCPGGCIASDDPVTPCEFQLVHPCGSGVFSSVMLARVVRPWPATTTTTTTTSPGDVVALKVMDEPTVSLVQRRAMARDEYRILRLLNHVPDSAAVRAHAQCTLQDQPTLVLEPLECTLLDVIRSSLDGNGLSMTTVRSLARLLLRALDAWSSCVDDDDEDADDGETVAKGGGEASLPLPPLPLPPPLPPHNATSRRESLSAPPMVASRAIHHHPTYVGRRGLWRRQKPQRQQQQTRRIATPRVVVAAMATTTEPCDDDAVSNHYLSTPSSSSSSSSSSSEDGLDGEPGATTGPVVGVSTPPHSPPIEAEPAPPPPPGLVHADLKPENIMFRRWRGTLTPNHDDLAIIDFSSSFFAADGTSADFSNYIQSRYYRAPEVTGRHAEWTAAIDVWSVATILFEAYTGRPLFPGRNERHMIEYWVAILGPPPDTFVQACTRPPVRDCLGILSAQYEGRRRRKRRQRRRDRRLQRRLARAATGACVRGDDSSVSDDSDDSDHDNRTLDGLAQRMIHKRTSSRGAGTFQEQAEFIDFLASLLTWMPSERSRPAYALTHEFLHPVPPPVTSR